MKKKLVACGFCLMLLLSQNAFVFAQDSSANPRSNDELINLFDDPDLIAVIQVKKILNDTAPILLSAHPDTIGKIKKTMKNIENDFGINPYSVEKVVFGMSMKSPGDSVMIVVQTIEPSAALIDKLFASQTANAKFAPEINPLKNRVDFLERKIRPVRDEIIPANQPGEEDSAQIEKFQAGIEAVTPLKPERAAYGKLKNDAARLLEVFKKQQSLKAEVYSLGDLEKRLADVKEQINSIEATDPNRAAKIAAADKALLPLEKEFNERRARMFAADETFSLAFFSSAVFAEVPEMFPTVPSQRKTLLTELQASVDERINTLNSIIETMSAKEFPESESLKNHDEEIMKNPAFPLSQTVSRKNETVGGKTLVTITTDKTFPETSSVIESTVEDEYLIFDDRTIIIGERPSLEKTVEAKTANSNQVAKNLIARSPDALVSFGFNFRNIDISELAQVFGESKTAWQVIGSLDSTGNDFSVTTAFEKSDVPVNVQPKKPDSSSVISTPPIPVDDETKELVESMFKSMIGIEARITIRFDKQKTARFIEKSPEILSRILKR